MVSFSSFLGDLVMNGGYLRVFLLSLCHQEGWCLHPWSWGKLYGTNIRVRDKGDRLSGKDRWGRSQKSEESMFDTELSMAQMWR